MNEKNTTEYSDEVFVAGEGCDKIGFGRYRGDTKLKKVIIAESVREIESSAFRDCTSLCAVKFTNGLKRLGHEVFRGCTALEKVVLPASLEEMNWNVFEGCTALKQVVFQSALPSVHGFWGCTALERVVIPSAGYIGVACFKNCTALKQITLPDDIDGIGSSAFSGCTALERIEIPEGVRRIDEQAFSGCTSLKQVVFYSRDVYVRSNAFEDCTSLEKIHIGRGVRLGITVFRGCTALKRITVIDDSRYYVDDGCLVDKKGDTVVWSPDGRIPPRAKRIGGGMFYKSDITSFEVPFGIEALDDYAFAESALTEITLPNTVKRISLDAFEDCFGLRTVYFKGTRYEWNEIDVDYDSYVSAYDNGDDCNLVKGIDYDGSIDVVCEDDE